MDFALMMLLLIAATGGIWLLDIFVLKRRRAPGVAEPWWVEYPKSFFPVILAVFLLRSFLVEPFKIPSGSMLPTLLVGDFILVNKFAYGIRVPVINNELIEIGHPQHGDVMVFRYPENPTLDYIKRVVGVPGDHISYHDKRLTVNGEGIATEPDGEFGYTEPGLNYISAERRQETLGAHRHAILVHPGIPDVHLSDVRQFPFRENCVYNETGFDCTVPAGNYFMMGDNRDGSSDSRYWGFVPDRNIVGKAFVIWWNFKEFSRVGQKIQ